MAGRLQDVILRGLAAARPLSADVGPGTLYFATDTNVTTRNNDTMTAWESYSGAAAGTGDVLGPASSVLDHIPQFADTTGKLLKDGLGLTLAVASPGVDTQVPSEKAVRDAINAIPASGGDVVGPASALNNEITLFDGTTGKLIKGAGAGLTTTVATPGVDTLVPTEKAVRDAITAGGGGGGGGTVVGGALTLLGTYPAAAVASLNITTRTAPGMSGAIFQSDYDVYKLVINDVVFSLNSTSLGIRYSSNGGTTYDTGANYGWGGFAVVASGTGAFGANGQTSLTLVYQQSNAAKTSANGDYNLYNLNSTTLYKNLIGLTAYTDFTRTTDVVGMHLNGKYNIDSVAVNAFQLLASTGTFTGTIKVYGVGPGNIAAGVPSGALQFIEEQNPTGVTSLTFSNLGQFTHLKLMYSARGTQAATSTQVDMRLNGDATAIYDRQRIAGAAAVASVSESLNQTSVTQVFQASAANAPAGMAGAGEITFLDYRGTTFHKRGTTLLMWQDNTGAGQTAIQSVGWAWRNTAAITSITLTLASGNFLAGSKFTLYGLGSSNSGAGVIRRQVTVIIDGAGSAITTGLKTFLSMPTSGTLKKWRLLSIDTAATVGSIVIDIWKDNYGAYPPTVADTITAAAKPTLTAVNKNESSTLTGWTTAFAAGDTFGFNVDSVATVTKVMLVLEFE